VSEGRSRPNQPSKPWELPLDDSYWNVLLEDVERSTSTISEPGYTRPSQATGAPARQSSSQPCPPPSTEEDTGLLAALDATEAPPESWNRWSAEVSNPANDWERAATLFETKDRVDLEVTGYNRGGLLVQFGRIQGFVPTSQLLDLPRELDSQARQSELAGRVGAKLCLRVIELDRDRNRLIFSERAAADSPDAESLLQTLAEGDILAGRVTNLCGFGVFVDLGGVEGLIHISELSWGRVNHPSDVLKPGDEIRVYVMGIEPEQHRVALSLKRLKPDPWSLVDKRYTVGQCIEGEVTNVVSFGAFVRIDEGLEGLIHISELAEGNFLHPRNVVKEGDRVTARILNIDSDNHRLGLSLRQLVNHGEAPAAPLGAA
jgi:small subunit ribosomal protein S1